MSCNMLEIKLFVLSMQGRGWYTAAAFGINGTEASVLRVYWVVRRVRR